MKQTHRLEHIGFCAAVLPAADIVKSALRRIIVGRHLARSVLFTCLALLASASGILRANAQDQFNVNTGYGIDGPPQPLLPGMPPDIYMNTPDCYKGTTVVIYNWWITTHRVEPCEKYVVRTPPPLLPNIPDNAPSLVRGPPDTHAPVVGSPDYANHILGAETGISECLRQACSSPAGIVAVAASMAAVRYKMATVLAGISLGGAGLSLHSALSGPGQPASNSPFDVGKFQGQRFCAWLGVAVSVTGAISAAKIAATTPPPRGSMAACYAQPPAAPTALGQLLADLSWLREINPTRNTSNCGNTALAVDQVLAGRTGLPAPPQSCAGTRSTQLESLTGGEFAPQEGAGPVNNAIYHAGNGARGIVHAASPNGGGHYFNIVNNQNNVMLLDGQAGKQISWGELQSLGFNLFSLLRTN